MEKDIKKYSFLKIFVPIILAILVILLTCAYTNAQNGLSDIDNHWSKKYVEYLTTKGAINGYPDGTFRPDNSVTYAEAIKLIVATFNENIDYGSQHWAINYLNYAKQMQIVPNNMNLENKLDEKISRKEVIYMVYQSLLNLAYKPITNNDRTEIELPFTDVTIDINKYGIDYIKPISECYYLGIVIGHDTGLMCPNDTITRAEMATIMSRAYSEELRIYPTKYVESFFPDNLEEYRMVLTYMSNDFYEAGSNSFAQYVEGQAPYNYLDPVIRDATDVALSTTRNNAEIGINALLNVSYDMSDIEWSLWKKNILIFSDVSEEQINEYVEYVKDNRISIKGGALMNPCTIGVFRTNSTQGLLGMKGQISYKIEMNPEHKKYLTIAEYITKTEMISNVNNPKYVIMYLKEGTDISIYSLYNYKYNMTDIMYIGE